MLGICRGSSVPGRPKTNAIAENKVKQVLQGARTVLDHAGVPTSYWPFEARHFTLCRNHIPPAKAKDGDLSPIEERGLPDEYALPKFIPFGSLVEFKPSPIHFGPQGKRKLLKWGTRTVPGVFLLYKSKAGGLWDGTCKVALLSYRRGESRKFTRYQWRRSPRNSFTTTLFFP